MANNLAQFIQEQREKLYLSTPQLAQKASIPLKTLESIESSQELFLASTTRQKLAKALRIEPDEIKFYERTLQEKIVSQQVIDRLKRQILNKETNLACPKCGAILVSRVAQMYDLEDNMILHPKARCSKCPYQLK